MLENEKGLTERMVTRLKHKLHHLMPHDPDNDTREKPTEYNGYDDIDYSAYYTEINDIVQDDAVSTRHRLEQRRIMHAIIRRTLSSIRMVESDPLTPLSAPLRFWEYGQDLCVDRQTRNSNTRSTQDDYTIPRTLAKARES